MFATYQRSRLNARTLFIDSLYCWKLVWFWALQPGDGVLLCLHKLQTSAHFLSTPRSDVHCTNQRQCRWQDSDTSLIAIIPSWMPTHTLAQLKVSPAKPQFDLILRCCIGSTIFNLIVNSWIGLHSLKASLWATITIAITIKCSKQPVHKHWLLGVAKNLMNFTCKRFSVTIFWICLLLGFSLLGTFSRCSSSLPS